MIKILFVCYGNICRSPMAEYVMKDLVKKAGLADRFQIGSAATSREELGNPIYSPARRKLAEHGISCQGHAARQLTRRDYDEYDLLVGMDAGNLRDMRRICGGDPAESSPFCWTIPPAPARLPTRGIPGTLKPLGAMCWRAVRACCRNAWQNRRNKPPQAAQVGIKDRQQIPQKKRRSGPGDTGLLLRLQK